MRIAAALYLIWLAVATSPTNALATPLEPRCLQTHNVQNRALMLGAQSTSCVLLERYRASIFRQYNDFAGNSSLTALNEEISRLQNELDKAERERDWTGFMTAANVAGNLIATIGLAACAETAGVGCALAVVGSLLAKLGVIDSGMSAAEKQAVSNSIREDLSRSQQILTEKQGNLSASQERLGAEFLELCRIVREHCL